MIPKNFAPVLKVLGGEDLAALGVIGEDIFSEDDQS